MSVISEFLTELVERRSVRRVLLVVAAVCAFYPGYFFLWYMSDRGFYAFEAFGNVVGIVVPFLFMAFIFGLLLLLLALLLWGGPVLLFAILLQRTTESSSSARSLKRDLFPALGFGALNLFLWAALTWAQFKSETSGFPFLSLALAAGVVAAVFAILSATKAEHRLGVVILLLGFGLLAPAFEPALVREWVESTLRQFRLGGVAVTMISGDTQQREVAYLVFLSPSHAYLEVGCPPTSVILPRHDGLRLEFTRSRLPGSAKCDDEPAPGEPPHKQPQ